MTAPIFPIFCHFVIVFQFSDACCTSDEGAVLPCALNMSLICLTVAGQNVIKTPRFPRTKTIALSVISRCAARSVSQNVAQVCPIPSSDMRSARSTRSELTCRLARRVLYIVRLVVEHTSHQTDSSKESEESEAKCEIHITHPPPTSGTGHTVPSAHTRPAPANAGYRSSDGR